MHGPKGAADAYFQMRNDALLIGSVALGLVLLGSAYVRPKPRLNPAPSKPRPLPRRPRRGELARSRLEELLDLHLASEPTPGKFYQVQAGDTPEFVLRAALEDVGTHREGHLVDYLYCVVSSPWNLDLYGTPSTSRSYPQRFLVPGIGLGVRAAFLPRNAEALAMMRQGLSPSRTVDRDGRATDDSAQAFGLLWLPPVCPECLDVDDQITCAPFSWEDGTSTINPDPELLALLGGRA